MREFYAELPISIRITGNYHDIGAFASDVGKLSRIVTLNDITLTAGQGRHARHGRDRQDLPLPRRGGDRERSARPPRTRTRRGASDEAAHRCAARRASLALAACCGGEPHGDLRQFVKDSENLPHGRIPPLPEVKPYEPFTYSGVRSHRSVQAAQDRAAAAARGAGGLAPDLNRRREPLEAYPAREPAHGRHARAEESRCSRS